MLSLFWLALYNCSVAEKAGIMKCATFEVLLARSLTVNKTEFQFKQNLSSCYTQDDYVQTE